MPDERRPHSSAYLANEVRNALISMRDESDRSGHAAEAEQGLAALERLVEQLEAMEVSRDAWRSDAEVFQSDRDELKEQLEAAQSWYRDHVTEDGIYDAQTWGDPFAVSNPAKRPGA